MRSITNEEEYFMTDDSAVAATAESLANHSPTAVSREATSAPPSSHTIHHRAADKTRLSFSTFASLRHRDYRLLWTGTLFMSAGQWIQQVTLGWLLYDMTGSSVLLGVLNGLRTLPFLVTGPLAGVAADRMNRRHLLLMTQLVLFLTAYTMGTLVVNQWAQVWHLFVFALITGTAWSFNQPVRQTLVPNIVPKADLMNAIALNSVGFNITKVIGPTLGGLLIAWFGAGGNFFVQGTAYLMVLGSIYLMYVPPTPAAARQTSAADNLKEGLRYVRSHPLVLTLIVASLIPNIFAMPYNTLMPIFQKDVFQLGPESLGLMLAAPGVGAVISTLGLASVTNRIKRKGVLMLASLVVLGFSLMAFAWSPSLPLALVALAFVGACQILFNATTNTLLQMIVPDELRGRVMSIYMLDVGMVPLGAMFAGITTSFIGAPNTVTIMGAIVVVLAVLVAWRVPRIREVRM
jgi:predicted MFS family arabinose efflux permease